MRKETMKEMAAYMKAVGFEPIGMNAAKEKLQRHIDGGIADARDRLRSSAQCESTVLALSDLLNETQKKAMLLVADNDRLRAELSKLAIIRTEKNTAILELASLRAANARLQAWHDAVMAQGCVYTSQRGIDWMSGNAFRTTEVGAQTSTRTIALIIRPQPLAKE